MTNGATPLTMSRSRDLKTMVQKLAHTSLKPAKKNLMENQEKKQTALEKLEDYLGGFDLFEVMHVFQKDEIEEKFKKFG